MKKVGVWIDRREANIINLENESIQKKTIYSDIETRVRYEGEGKQFGRFGDQYLVDEKGKQNRQEHQMHRYLHRVMDELKNADQIMLFGPAQTKDRLHKMIIENPNMADKMENLLVSDSMTDNQKIAYVKKFYGEN